MNLRSIFILRKYHVKKLPSIGSVHVKTQLCSL